MARQVFTGSVIHAIVTGEVIFKDNATIFVDNGKVFNIFHILLLPFFCFSSISNIDKY